MTKGLRRIILLLFLFTLTQLTRPESTIIITVDNETISASTHGSTVQGSFINSGPLSLAARFRKGTGSETYISRIVARQSGNEQAIHNRPTIFLWGREILGTALRGAFPHFQRTFGDWTTDVYNSDPVALGTVARSSPLTLSVSVLGRGELRIDLSTQQGGTSSVHFHDGTINNALGVTFASGGDKVTTTANAPVTNLVRIANAALECIFGGLLLLSMAEIILSVCGSSRSPFDFTRYYPAGVKNGSTNYTLLLLALAPCALLHFAITLYFALDILGGVPHISDSAIYYRQALALLTGHICAPLPPTQPYEVFLTNGATIIKGEVCYRHATHTWPALLAIGIKVGMPWLVSPLISALGVLASGVLIGRFLGVMPALLGTLLIATSPFSIVMAGEYMMHGAVFGLLACGLACVVYSFDRGSLSTSVLGGALLCLAATMRQATVVAILIPWALTLVLWWRQKIVSLQSAAVVGGALIMGALFVIDCKAITGSYLLLPHTHLHGLGLTVENLRAGADHVDSMVGWHLAPMILSLPANGWTVSLVGAGLWVTPRRFLVALLGPLLMLVVTHLFVSVHGLHGYGARFLYEASPALLVLIGLFFCALLSAAQERSSVLIALGYLAVFAANGWSLATILPTYRNYNALSSELASAICNISSQRAVVVLPSGSWQATDVAAACYDPTYSKRVYIQSDERYNWRAALRFFEEWDIYRVEGNKVVSLDASQEF